MKECNAVVKPMNKTASKNIIIREMIEADVDEVLSIEKKSFSTPWSKEAFHLEITKNNLAKYIVAIKQEKIVGYAGMWMIIDEGHITNIAVDPEVRGEGIGNLLVKELVNICKSTDMRAVTLEVRRTNYVAQSLYKKYEFQEAGVRPAYYSDNKEDAIIMWKEFY